MVAAWIRALTGVGPAMASGSQTYSGIWALLPQAPTNKRMQAAVSTPVESIPEPAASRSPSTDRVPAAPKRMNMPIKKPRSPMRLTMKAFLPAEAFSRSSNQKPISK